MTRKTAKPKTALAVRNPNALEMTQEPGRSKERTFAALALGATAKNAMTAKRFSGEFAGPLDITESVAVMRELVGRVNKGDMTGMEETLVAQAVALDAIFNEMARRASLNMGQHLGAAETYLRLALRAQRQCMETVTALSEIKNPRSVAFVKQANIAHGHQQVNNGEAVTEPCAQAGNFGQSRLLRSDDGERLDCGAQSTSSGADPHLAAVGAFNRAEDARR